jgi:hypothetical protein
MDFFDVHQEMRINQQRNDISDVSRTAARAKSEVEELRAKLDRLHLASTAMWEILNEQFDVSEKEFLAKVQEIDLRDGRLDGRLAAHVASPPTACPECGRTNNGKRTACLYCGLELPPVSPL